MTRYAKTMSDALKEVVNEDGHADVASAIRQCKTTTEDAMQILQKLQSMSPEDNLPTWWTNKLAIASNNMNKIRDYLLVPSVSEGLELHEKAGDENDMKKLVGELQNASKLHLAQSKRVKAHVDMMKAGNLKGTLELVRIVRELENASEAHLRQSKALVNHMEKMNESAIKEQPEHEIKVGDYTTKHFHMCGSAQKVMKKHADKEGAEELTKLQDKFYEIEMMAMNAGKPTDEQITQTKSLYDQIMKKAEDMGIADEVGDYMKMHMDSMEKGDPELGFGRTDKDDGKEPVDEAMKMNDPKLNKIFDKLKRGDKIKIKHDSVLEKGKDFIEYKVTAKNTVRKGTVEKITLARIDNPTSVKKFMYRRDGKVTFAIGDMGATIADIKEVVELDEKWPPEELESPPEFGTTRKSSEGPAAMMHNKIGRNLYEPSVKAKLDRIDTLKLNDLAMQGNFKGFYNYVQKLSKDDQDVVIGAFGKAAKEFFGNKGVEYTKNLFKIKKLNMSEEVGLDEAKFSPSMIDKLRKAYEPMKGKKINPTPLMKIFDKIDSNKDGLIQLYKADIPFVSTMAMSRLTLKHNMKADEIKKLKEEVELEEKKRVYRVTSNKLQGNVHAKDEKEAEKIARSKGMKGKLTIQDRGEYKGQPTFEKYDLYHKSFSDAMQHAYDYAKKKLGITVDPKEIDSKVATGPRKPSEGKTNKYRLKGKGGNLQIQVYNKGGSKPFELNMYKEENEMNEKKKLKPGAKFDFQLFDPEDSPGSDKANDDMNKEIQKAVRMKDKETARQYMMKVQKKHSKHGATDTEPREIINQILDAIYEAREKFDEGYESEVKKVLDKEGIDGYFKNGKLYVSKRDAKDAKKALEDSDEITKLPPMVKEENDMTKNLKETIMDMWKEAVSPAQQAAIAISKKEKEKEEGNAFTGALKAAKEKGEKTFTVAGKEYDVKTEKLVGGQKKLDKDKDGDIDGKDFAMMRKKTEDIEHERQRYLETKKGSLRDAVLKVWGEVNEKIEYVEYDFKNKNDAMKAKKMLDGIQLMNFDINDDGISRGMLTVDAGNRDMTKYHKEIMKMYKPRIVAQEKKDLTKSEKRDTNKETDTGKEMTPVDMSPKMPKVKESKNKV